MCHCLPLLCAENSVILLLEFLQLESADSPVCDECPTQVIRNAALFNFILNPTTSFHLAPLSFEDCNNQKTIPLPKFQIIFKTSKGSKKHDVFANTYTIIMHIEPIMEPFCTRYSPTECRTLSCQSQDAVSSKAKLLIAGCISTKARSNRGNKDRDDADHIAAISPVSQAG